MSGINILKIQKELLNLSYVTKSAQKEVLPKFTLSKNGKNVIVFMLDRAISGFIPMIFEENPGLKESFSGFTYYPNTISFGMHTVFGAPPLFGGYEYTPQQMNERSSEKLVEKHNEAIKVMPVIFLENDYDVTVCDIPYANYNLIPDLSVYDEYPEIKKFLTIGRFTEKLKDEFRIEDNFEESNRRNFFCYSVFKISPLVFQNFLYDGGDYYSSKIGYKITKQFLDNYAVLHNLKEMTEINENSNNFIMIDNELTHEPVFIPDYNIKMDDREANNDSYFSFRTATQQKHYQINMTAMLLLASWFDFMRESGVYDNTRIIIVSDHGMTNDVDSMGLEYWSSMIMKEPKIDISTCNPLLMVKDFNAKGFSTDNTFMTNADVPLFATNEVVKKAVNPFTGKAISSDEKNLHPQLVTSSHNLSQNPQDYKFDTSDGHWYSVHDNIFDEANWERIVK